MTLLRSKFRFNLWAPLCLLALFLFAGCSALTPQSENNRADDGSELSEKEETSSIDIEQLAKHSVYIYGDGAVHMGTLTPEQVSNAYKAAIGIQIAGETNGVPFEFVKDAYGISLGGVDFITNYKRKRSVDASFLLAASAVAAKIPPLMSWAILDPTAAAASYVPIVIQGTPIFNSTEFLNDRPSPLGSNAQHQRWKAAVERVFWALFSRPPREDEVEAVRSVFVKVLGEVNYPPRAWEVVLSALFSTSEFWSF